MSTSKSPTTLPYIHTQMNPRTVWCNGEMMTFYYSYEVCPPSLFRPGGAEYRCEVKDIADDACQMKFKIVVSVQLLIVTVALLLNSIIVINFFRRRPLRKKIHNILLFNQAVADTVNCLVYALPNLILVFYIMLWGYSKKTWRIYFRYRFTMTLTMSSSLFILAVIATERFLSICKPLWHRVNLRKRYIWRSILASWLISLIISGVWLLEKYDDKGNYIQDQILYKIEYGYIPYTILGILMLFVTFLFIFTFVKAFRSVKAQTASGSAPEITRAKKQFRLTCLFCIMFFIFILGFLSIMIASVIDDDFDQIEGQILVTLFVSTSILNPLTTFTFKKDFRARISKRSHNTGKPANAIQMISSSNSQEGSRSTATESSNL